MDIRGRETNRHPIVDPARVHEGVVMGAFLPGTRAWSRPFALARTPIATAVKASLDLERRPHP